MKNINTIRALNLAAMIILLFVVAGGRVVLLPALMMTMVVGVMIEQKHWYR
tara:strand:+ start:11439 stop:11591 length:153 start_codon:yes stop_codon:yes gene_type:complete